MARIRSIKPETALSESLGKISRDARLTFILLWTQADDLGRFRAASRMLASLLFPFDDDAPKLMDGWLGELEQAGCIRRYEVEGTTYGDIPKWLMHQKIDHPSKSHIPEFAKSSDGLARTSETLAPDLGPRTMDLGSKDTHPSGEPNPQLVADCWNAMAKANNLPEVQKLTDARKRLAAARLRDAGGLEGIQAAVAKVAASPWLKGLRNGAGHENWRCTFDYLISERGFTKIMEGNYDERGNGAASDRDHPTESKGRQFARGLASVLGGDEAGG